MFMSMVVSPYRQAECKPQGEASELLVCFLDWMHLPSSPAQHTHMSPFDGFKPTPRLQRHAFTRDRPLLLLLLLLCLKQILFV